MALPGPGPSVSQCPEGQVGRLESPCCREAIHRRAPGRGQSICPSPSLGHACHSVVLSLVGRQQRCSSTLGTWELEPADRKGGLPPTFSPVPSPKLFMVPTGGIHGTLQGLKCLGSTRAQLAAWVSREVSKQPMLQAHGTHPSIHSTHGPCGQVRAEGLP